MKPSLIITTESNSYKFKLKYSTLCELKEMGVDLLSEEGTLDLQKDATKIRYIFWKGLECGENKKYEKEKAFEIFDEVMEDVGPEAFSEMIPKALAIKTNQKNS